MRFKKIRLQIILGINQLRIILGSLIALVRILLGFYSSYATIPCTGDEEVERLAMKIVLKYEREAGRKPEDVSKGHVLQF